MFLNESCVKRLFNICSTKKLYKKFIKISTAYFYKHAWLTLSSNINFTHTLVKKKTTQKLHA